MSQRHLWLPKARCWQKAWPRLTADMELLASHAPLRTFASIKISRHKKDVRIKCFPVLLKSFPV